MKTISYNTSRRTRRETFPDGSQLIRRAGGGYEIIEARPKYGVPMSPIPPKAQPNIIPKAGQGGGGK